jgi:hypothetical protein
MNTRRFDIYAPLQEFDWDGKDFELAPGLWINRFRQPPDLCGLHERIAKEEWENASNVGHWLTFCWTDGVVPCPAEIANLVLLSFWLVKPTTSHISYRFHIGRAGADHEQSAHRLLDQFDWVSGAIHPCFEDQDLQSASTFYAILAQLCCARGRLNDALCLTLSGCWSHRWQVALICYAAAAEAMLTYDTVKGITNRLAKSYACVTETLTAQRDAAFQEFVDLYDVRSDIMHGRTHNITANDRLPTLVRFRDVLRRLWQTVLSSPHLIAVLEGTDAQRKVLFQALEQDYAVPHRKRTKASPSFKNKNL